MGNRYRALLRYLGIAVFILVALLIGVHRYWFDLYLIPSGSMLPTLSPGDIVLALKRERLLNKDATRHSTGTRTEPAKGPGAAMDIQRGDVVTFLYSKESNVIYVKRVIALPGDHISYTDNLIRINGRSVERIYQYDTTYRIKRGQLVSVGVYRESLGGKSYHIYRSRESRSRWGTATVPAGHYFVMGDNREASEDSRQWGAVPAEYIAGKVVVTLWKGESVVNPVSPEGQ